MNEPGGSTSVSLLCPAACLMHYSWRHIMRHYSYALVAKAEYVKQLCTCSSFKVMCMSIHLPKRKIRINIYLIEDN